MTSADYQRAKRNKEALEALLASEGWGLLTQALITQIDHRRKAAMTPLHSGENPLQLLFSREAEVCEAGGMMLALDMPTTLMEACEYEIEMYQQSLAVRESVLDEE